ncbi:MAG: leucine-rich repeat protein [Oscillospiraceae bacterium]
MNIPDNIEFIDVGAFIACKSLRELTIPDNISAIMRAAFDDCDALTVTYKGQK